MRIYLLGLLAVLSVSALGDEPVARYLAWFDGDYQTDYQTNREIASERLRELEKSPPKPSEEEKYLEYISLVDAAGRGAEAQTKLKAFLAAKPGDKRAVFLLAVHYWRANKKEMTQFLFTQLEKDGDFQWKSLLYNNLGMLALQDKNRQAAISHFERATKSSPKSAAPFVNLGALYLQSRSYAAAEPLFETAVDIDGEFEDAALGLGIALEGQGKFEAAHKVYANFMEEQPTSLSVVYNDSILLGNKLGKKSDAAAQMMRYIQRGGKETAKAQEIIQTWR